MIQLFLSI